MGIINRAMDKVSFLTHFIGAVGSLVLLLVMLIIAFISQSELESVLGAIVFALSSIALYSASSCYHFYNGDFNSSKTKRFLRKFDHAMIYVLIAGTYTPICLKYLKYPHNYYFLLVIWLIALMGITVKLFWINAPRFISTAFYLLMGWALIFDFSAFKSVPLGCFVLLAIGGISYTIGAVIYALKKPNWFKSFGFHELFHIFVMIGSLFHFIAVIVYVL